jgi:hypothetical protein
MFHPLFPWYQCGAKFDIDLARLNRTPPSSGTFDMSLIGFCVPQLYSRRLPRKDGWGEARKLIYDDWMLPQTAAVYSPEYWDSVVSVKAMANSVDGDLMVDEPKIDSLQFEHGNDDGLPPASELDIELDFGSASGIAPMPLVELRKLREDFLQFGSWDEFLLGRFSELNDGCVTLPVIDLNTGENLHFRNASDFAPPSIFKLMEISPLCPVIDHGVMGYLNSYAGGSLPFENVITSHDDLGGT